jgi:hypothetical protein
MVVVVVVVMMMEDGQRGSRGGVVQGQDRPKSSCSPFFVSRACRTQDTPAGLTGPRNGGLGWGLPPASKNRETDSQGGGEVRRAACLAIRSHSILIFDVILFLFYFYSISILF